MFIKICRSLDNDSDISMLECDEYRFCLDPARESKQQEQFLLTIHATNRTDGRDKIEWVLSGEMQVYVLNNEGKTIDRIY
jgi:hypothetical protein